MEDFTSEEHIGWDFYERPQYERGRTWRIAMPLIGLGLLIYAVLSVNFLFAFIIILFSLISYLASIGPREKVRFSVTDSGIMVGQHAWAFRDIKRFWFVYEPPEVKSLYLLTNSLMHPRMNIHLDDVDPNDVRTALGRFVKEEIVETDEPISDFVSRILKL